MTRNEKAKLIDFLVSEFKEADAVAVCNYKGMTVKELEALRNVAREQDIKVQVVKNKLALVAFDTIGAKDMVLKDTNIFVWGADQIALAKVIQKFADDSKIFTIKSGYVDSEVCDANKIEALSKLASKEELIGMLLSVWMGPLRNFVTGLDNLKTKLEEE